MKVTVVANVEQHEEIMSKITNPEAEVVFLRSFSAMEIHENYDAFFFMKGDIDFSDMEVYNGKPVFINSVTETLGERKLPANFSRINGWPGFLKRQTWEVASNNKAIAGEIFEGLGWHIIFVKDEPGLVAARVISMIINEAFFALEEGVSTMDEMDLAMKLGTNYPHGPFEWLQRIGVQNIFPLLQKLSTRDKRYFISPLMEKKYFEFISSQ